MFVMTAIVGSMMSRSRTPRLGFVEEVMSVELLALQRHEERVRHQVPGVRGDGGEREFRRRGDLERRSNFIAGPRPSGRQAVTPSSHQFAPKLRTTSRSSNGSLVVPTTW